MSIWSELEGVVTFHEKDHISIEKCFKDALFNEHGFECIFSYTQPQSKWNDKVTSYFRVATDIDILMLSDVLREIEADIRRKYPKCFTMDISIHTRFLI